MPCFLSGIYQSVKININENGTIAAAATIGVMNRASINFTNYIKFTANKPFFVFIYDKNNKIPLFSIFVKNPNQKN